MPHLNQETHFPTGPVTTMEGFYLDDLASGTALEIETRNRNYRLFKRANAHVRISGHPTYCPEPVEVEVEGSFGSGLKSAPHPGFIGRGMYMMFKHPLFGWITTSQILEIHKLGQAATRVPSVTKD